MRVRFLGTGTSNGVPMIGCECAVCLSDDQRDKRTRCSIVVEQHGQTILVDSATELRLQATRARLARVDAVLYTHTHADHIFGLDDLRSFYHLTGQPTPIYGTAEALATLRRTFHYVFEGPTTGGGKPRLDLCPIDGPFAIGGVEIEPIPVLHGDTTVQAFRFGRFAYVTDTNFIPEPSLERLRGLDVLVLDALRDRPHPTHFSVPEALAIVAELAPKRTYFTHMCHDLGHVATNERLPPSVELAYDDLTIEVAD